MGQDFLNLCLSAYRSFLNPYLNESVLRDGTSNMEFLIISVNYLAMKYFVFLHELTPL